MIFSGPILVIAILAIVRLMISGSSEEELYLYVNSRELSWLTTCS